MEFKVGFFMRFLDIDVRFVMKLVLINLESYNFGYELKTKERSK